MQFTEAPKANMNTKKNAIEAEEVACSLGWPRKLNRMETIIMQIPSVKDPQIMGARRPTLSTKKVGKRLPKTNMIWTQPPMICERLRVRPTLSWRTVGMKYLRS